MFCYTGQSALCLTLLTSLGYAADSPRQFVGFLLHGNGRAVLAGFGHNLPAP